MRRIFTIIYKKPLSKLLNSAKQKAYCNRRLYREFYKVRYAVLVAGLLCFAAFPGFGQVKASFTISNLKDTVGCVPLDIKFVNNSTNAVSYKWDFGDGNKSTLSTPSNVYLKPGRFSVKLIAIDSNGSIDSITYSLYIRVVDSPVANFYASATIVCPGYSLYFKNISSSANSYIWDFGDGDISTQASPSYSYSDTGYHTVKLIAKNQYGCQSVKSDSAYIYVRPPAIPVFSVNAKHGCSTSQEFIFTNNSKNASSYIWNFGDGVTSSSVSPTHYFSNPGTYTVKLYATAATGCTDSLVYANFITIDSSITPVFSANKISGCPPFSVNFTSTTLSSGRYYWSFGDNDTSSSATTQITHSYKTTGFYSVTLKVVNSYGCADSVTYKKYITVDSMPVPKFTVSSTGCKNSPLIFNNTTSGATTYSWNFGDNTSSSQKQATHAYSDTGSFTVKLYSYSANGCRQVYTIANAVHITGPFSGFSGNMQNGCPPLKVKFTSSSSGAVKYLWLFGDSTTDSGAIVTHSFNNVGKYNVTLVSYNSNGCTDTLTKSNYISVSNASASYTTPKLITTCAPLMEKFADPFSNDIAWEWNFGDGSTSTSENPTHTYLSEGKYRASLTVTNANGCKIPISDLQDFNLEDINPGFTTTTHICPPSEITFNDTSTGAVSWVWDFGDGTSSTSKNPDHVYEKSGYYSIKLTVTNSQGCSYTLLKNDAVKVNALEGKISWTGNDSVFPTTLKFTSNSVGATKWTWNFGDSTALDTQQNPSHYYADSGKYKITLIISNGTCQDTLISVMQHVVPQTSLAKKDSGIVIGTGGKGNSIVSCAPLRLDFTDTASNAISWNWNFGDSSYSSSQNPSHYYTTPGVYTVTLIEKLQSGAYDTIVQKGYVRISGPTSYFNVSQKIICGGSIANFTDSSKNAIFWYWNFGDSTLSTDQNPQHVYKVSDTTYHITLVTTDTFGCTNSISKSIYTGYLDPILASSYNICNTDSVFFTTPLSGAQSVYKNFTWDFGDSTKSTLANPTHQYTSGGSFSVMLTASDSNGCTMRFRLPDSIRVSKPVAAFSITGNTRGCDSVTVSFVNNSTGADAWYWNFGDSVSSNQKAPKHSFINTGSYNVELTASKGACSNTTTVPAALTINKAVALFTYTQDKVCFPITASFSDSSKNAISWLWTFGDGDSSTLENPVHVYKTAPVSSISLYVTDSNGCSAIATKANIKYLKAKFTASSKDGCWPMTVTFKDQSIAATAWAWNFGDSGTSTLQNPTHLYKDTGTYTVQLIVTSSEGCSDTATYLNYIKVVHPTSDFSAPATASCAPSYVPFTNLSNEGAKWAWDFGDGGTSTDQSPGHIYNNPGIFTVKLITFSKEGCSDTMIKKDYITVLGPVSSFKTSDTAGCLPLAIHFTDESKNAVDWSWNFGDGSTSTNENPSHVYTSEGTFTVSLITHDTTGCQSVFSMRKPLDVVPVPQASFNSIDIQACTPYVVKFTNTSTLSNHYLWVFGDGDSSKEANPYHSYTKGGVYDLYLIAYNNYGCTDTVHNGQMIHVNTKPVANFGANVIKGCLPFVANFIDSSTSEDSSTYAWDFGNGATSALKNPVETYTTPGQYTVKLVVTNKTGCMDTIIKKGYIDVYDGTPPPVCPIYAVSVNNPLAVNIKWQQSAAPQFQKYLLYRQNPVTEQWEMIQTITDRYTTSIDDSGLDNEAHVYGYKIQTVDMCEHTIGLDSAVAHYTIHVSTAAEGDQKILVTWTPYIGCEVSTYEVYRMQKGANAWEFAGTVPGNTLEFMDTTALCPFPFAYLIKATSLCGRVYASLSDTSVVVPPDIFQNQVVQIVRTTVVNNTSVLTEWQTPVVAPNRVINYNIYRSDDNINFIFLIAVSADTHIFIDSSVDVNTEHYYYQIQAVNSCNLSVPQSNKGNSILLGASENDNTAKYRASIQWSPYEGWKQGVDHYMIEIQNADGQWIFLKTVDGKTTSIQDNY